MDGWFVVLGVFKKVIGQEVGDDESPVTHSRIEQVVRSSPSPVQSPSYSSSSAVSHASVAGGATRNILSSDVEIKGTVKFANDLVVDGKIEGEIISTGNLTVGENARLKAEIRTGTVVVYGKVHGNITASSHIELKATAEVIGDIKAATLTIEAGAVFVGKSTVGAPAQGASPAASPVVASSPAVASTPAQASVKQASLLDESSAHKSMVRPSA